MRINVKKIIASGLLTMFLSFAILTGIAYAETLDQSNTTLDSWISTSTTYTTIYTGQKITVGKTGTLTKISVYLKKSGSFLTNYNIGVTTGTTVPGSFITDQPSVSATSVSTTGAWYTYTFTTQPEVETGDIIWIILYRVSYSTGNYLNWGISTENDYTGGGIGQSNALGAVNASSTYDGNFKVYIEVDGWSAFSKVGGVDPTTFSKVGGVDVSTISSFGGVDTGI